MTQPFLLGLLAALFVGGLLFAGSADDGSTSRKPPPGTRIERIAWGGWAEAYRISNGEAELVVVPAVSRILYYGFAGGPNLLWQNPRVAGRPPAEGEWANYGGSKAWIWPQDDWPARTGRGWPPPTELPATLASTATILAGKTLRLSSSPIPGYGMVLVREIRLEDTGTRVHSSSHLSNPGGEVSFAVAAWTVTQLPADGTLFARLLPGSRLADGYKPYTGAFAAVVREGRDLLVVERRADQGAKLGMDGDLVAWQRDDVLYVERPLGQTAQLSEFLPGERTQIYSHPDGDKVLPPGVSYIELELTSPLRTLRAGEVVTLETSFELVRLTPGERTRAGVAEKLRSM
jgi:hypothetical protein